jgi:hypothetical protein
MCLPIRFADFQRCAADKTYVLNMLDNWDKDPFDIASKLFKDDMVLEQLPFKVCLLFYASYHLVLDVGTAVGCSS